MRKTTSSVAKPKPAAHESVDSLRAKANKRNRQFKGVQFVKKVITTASVGMVAGSGMLNTATAGGGADGVFKPGSDRWTVKTSVAVSAPFTTIRPIEMNLLETLIPPVITSPKAAFENAWIPSELEGLKEGQIVTTTGYVHYVQYKSDDSDYHIQMNNKPTNELQDLDPCVVVEVPHPMATNDADLSQKFAMVRKFLRDNCFGGKAPKGKVDKVVKVQITGQLFFDVFHYFHNPNDLGGGRGSQLGTGLPMHATTDWEIHPIIDIKLAQ